MCRFHSVPGLRPGYYALYTKGEAPPFQAGRSRVMARNHADGSRVKITAKEINAEILSWIKGQLESKKFGTFGIEITLRDGLPVSIQKTDKLNYRRYGGDVLELSE